MKDNKNTVGLFPIGGNMENLAIMKISAWARTMGFEPILNQPGKAMNFVSCLMDKYRTDAEKLLALPNVVIGGSGWDKKLELPPEIATMEPDYSIYPECNYSLGFTSRGCDGSCKFCVVPEKEGHTRSVATIKDIWRPGTDVVVLLDNDFLGNPEYPERLAEAQEMDLCVNFNQALNIRKINDFNANLLAKTKFCNRNNTKKQIHFAFDNPENEEHVRKGVQTLTAAGIKPYRQMFYMLVAFDSSWEEDMGRFAILRELGVDPYVMFYDPISPAEKERVVRKYSEWEMARLRCFARWVNWRVYKAEPDFEQYDRWINRQKKLNKQEMTLF